MRQDTGTHKRVNQTKKEEREYGWMHDHDRYNSSKSYRKWHRLNVTRGQVACDRY